MLPNPLYNGRNFPEYIFSEEVKSYIFVEFDFVFTEDFWNVFKKYLHRVNVRYLIVENLVPNYLFRKRINVADLPESFIRIACTEDLEGYFSTVSLSLHVLTEKTLLYPEENEKYFCILLDKAYEIGIIGFVDAELGELRTELAIEDVPDYLRIAFASEELPGTFKDSLNKNWGSL